MKFLNSQRSNKIFTPVVLVLLFFAALPIYLAGLIADLPYATVPDEPVFVRLAVQINADGNLNPHWFGHPGSTVIYPLAAMYHLTYSIRAGEPILSNQPGIVEMLANRPTQFYVLGRLLNVGYGLLTILLVYLLGSRLFNRVAGVLAAAFFVFNPLIVYYVCVIRTDIAAVFWSTLSLLLIVRLIDRPTWKNQVFVAAAIGFGIGTRYLLAALIPIFVIVNVYHIFFNRATTHRKAALLQAMAGLLLVPVFFFISTPYFLIDFNTAVNNLRFESSSQHLGADGFTPFGNLWFYLSSALPQSIGYLQMIFALLGSFLVIRRKLFKPGLFILYSLGFLGGISLSSLHWNRWMIPIFPALALLSTYAVQEISNWISSFSREKSSRITYTTLAAVFLILIAVPAYQTTTYAISFLNPSTNIQAREWIYRNIPSDSKIVAEAYGPPMLELDYTLYKTVTAYRAGGIASYTQTGIQYLIVSSYIYGRYYDEPDRYTDEIQFYDTLFHNYPLLYEVKPELTTHGPIIRVYQVEP